LKNRMIRCRAVAQWRGRFDTAGNVRGLEYFGSETFWCGYFDDNEETA
jgi:hypothetical protein